jgi:hypothetical protein
LKAYFQKDYGALSEEVLKLKTRNNLTILGDKAISEDDSGGI